MIRRETRTSTMENWATSNTPQPLPWATSRKVATPEQTSPKTRMTGTTSMNTNFSLLVLKFFLLRETRRTIVMKRRPRRAEKEIKCKADVQM